MIVFAIIRMIPGDPAVVMLGPEGASPEAIRALRRGSFRSSAELRTAVVAFVAAWNRERAHPFRWTFTGYPLQAGSDRPAVEAA